MSSRHHSTVAPAVAAVRPKPLESNGQTRIDPYYWLRERENPEVIAYLEAENAYQAALMAHTEPLQAQLFQEMRARIQEKDQTVPVQIDDYYYCSRTEAGLQYPILCPRQGSMEAAEEILLDQNELAEGHTYFRVGASRVSPDHGLLAYTVDTNCSEQYTLLVKDLTSGALLSDQIPNTYYSLKWANSNCRVVPLPQAQRGLWRTL